MGRSNRRRERRADVEVTASNARRLPPPKPQWRETFDSWGGFPIFGSLAGILVLVVVLIYMNRAGASTNTAPYEPTARTPVAGRVVGDPNAPVKIIEFADFQCPFCKQWADGVEPKVYEEFIAKGVASLQYVSFAFLGEDSKRAAAAAECAADQNRFWDFHDLLFLRQGKENSGVFTNSNLKKFGLELRGKFADFDTGKFDQCVDSGAKNAAVETQTNQARSAGVQSTPSFLVNGTPISGVQPIEVFRTAIDNAQKAASK